MKIKTKIIKKTLLFAVVAGEISLLFFMPALSQARAPSVPSIAAQLERRYHLNLESMQNQGENFNVSDTKKFAPQVMLSFDPSDPKPGEKLTAEANPMYFRNAKESLYFTWYLKHKECNLGNIKSNDSQARKNCDQDKDDEVTVEDWKIKAARILASNEFDYEKALSSGKYLPDGRDSDADGHKEYYGGDDRYKMPSYCYIHDFKDGINYELVESVGGQEISCPPGRTPACIATETLNTNPISYRCVNAQENPICPQTGSGIHCSDPSTEPRCILESYKDKIHLGDYACNNPLLVDSSGILIVDPDQNNLVCRIDPSLDAKSTCSHLFPNAKHRKTGDNSFDNYEESFWRTDPEDPDTADNGNKDEASVMGLGRNIFSWNYQSGDKVGVFVEGTSTIPAKHDDSSMMVMWAYPKNKCNVAQKGVMYKMIKGYNVKIPIASVDFNDCLEDNLVDPREGGQATNLEISLSYSPENPRNDPTEDNLGDVVVAQSSIPNAAKNGKDIYYEWRVEKSNDGTASASSWTDITDKFYSITPQKGNNLSSLKFKLDLPEEDANGNDFFEKDVEYLRVRVKASENFSDGMTRDGKSSVIIKVFNTSERILARGVDVDDSGLLEIKDDDKICDEKSQDKAICPAVKNDIIGLKIKDDYKNYSWTLNDQPLICDKSVSTECCKSCTNEEKQQGKQGNVNFFPVTGNPGTVYTVNVNAINEKTGKTLQLTRVFQVVEPFIEIAPANENVWPKLLGRYKDLDGLCEQEPEKCDDYSKEVFETMAGSAEAKLKINFHPESIKNKTKINWFLDGEKESETSELSFEVNREIEETYLVKAKGLYEQKKEIRKALHEIWNVSQFDSLEKYMEDDVQVVVVDVMHETVKKDYKQFFASVIASLPENLVFMLRLALTVFLVVFLSGFLFTFNFQKNSGKI